jgi:hypothetical protein
MMNMPKQVQWILFVCLFISGQEASAQNMAAIIKTQAMEMARSVLSKDKEGILKFMHPKLIEMAGGKTEILNRMDSANSFAEKHGASIQKILVGHPLQVIHYKNEWQCTLPQTTTLTMPMGTMQLETTIVGISGDGGMNWYFLDTSMYGEKTIRRYLPDISPGLFFPAMKPPKITLKELKTTQ